ncbi:hypothetical protein [uncultured Shewanella sp.]|uniref:hypothetical protein n=1 Tax=uncultured Shewanella sp. TaxID=173975 RepID=UPI00260E99A6|nr:hypothetical protein [uncultured Shewanella sp.]
MMKKYDFNKMYIREVIFILICFTMVGTAFAMSEKNIVNSDGEVVGHIHFPTDSGQSADGVSLSLYDYTEANILTVDWELDPDTLNLMTFSLQAVTGTYPCSTAVGPCSYTKLKLTDSTVERSNGQCGAPATTTVHEDGTVSMSTSSCMMGMTAPETLTYVEALASYTCVGFKTPADGKHHKVMKMNKHGVLPLRAKLEDNEGHELGSDEVSASPVVQVMYTPSVSDVLQAEAVDVSAEVMGVGQANKAKKDKQSMQPSVGNSFVFKGHKWAFNLNTTQYSAPGLYTVSLVSGNSDEYAVTTPCETAFVVE